MTDEDGRIITTVGLYRFDLNTCEIRKMYLEAVHRGKGLGRRLLEHALSRAKALGYSRVELETASVLKEAIALYEGYGFRRFDRGHLALRCDAAYFLELKP
jgi:putative acetyltransferase